MFTTSGMRIKQSRHTITQRGTKSFEDTRERYVTFVDNLLLRSFYILADFLTGIEEGGGGWKLHLYNQTLANRQ
jgi:hypothetical protein